MLIKFEYFNVMNRSIICITNTQTNINTIRCIKSRIYERI